MTNKRDRKTQAWLQRDQLILETARDLLSEEGVAAISMQVIAERTEYSKGTIYQHYQCKEDVIAKLVIHCGHNLVSAIDSVIKDSHSLRLNVFLVSAAFFINAKQQPQVAALVSQVKAPEFQGKISHAHREELADIDNSILNQVISLFSESQEVPQDKVRTAAFGWWAMKWGVQDVLTNNWELSKLGFDHPIVFFADSLNVFLDGLGLAKDEQTESLSQVLQLATELITQNNNNENT
ncbi:TetR/AcrR family transcriptional regulator [Bermanella marisrubri]|uniref:Hypothetical transcriptional regulator n=1 Tax=Bermanella marisrubri TaxID=207949 RepID=Q1N549_9GAMM|nr:TetR/AcrR family transcriptional regulator [Bermanella marisrubri]EAT13229.1 Hypothetical transcriptional regulator [Oceanobacter sp. RED65] [Bermanella marisrubri]QIZ83998.1 TetR/AcrR family transcriptional regulator [Bermanella marisrubri]